MLMFLAFLALFISFAYAFVMLHFAAAWKNSAEEMTTDKQPGIFLSLVVAFKNEAEQLPQLLKSLSIQSYQHFELLLVNDHSSDLFEPIIQKYRQDIPFFHLITANGYGKKNALQEGIAKAKGKLIVCTDADCVPGKDWLYALAQFQEKTTADLIIAPVKLTHNTRLFSKIQALEFLSLAAATGGAAMAKMPLMCNGANLAFTPQIWAKSNQNLRTDIASGDDMFLLMQVKKQAGKIAYLKSQQAIVQTKPSENLKAFFNQRKRWVSKSKAYTDWQIIAVALLVLLVCVNIPMYLLAGFFNPFFWKVTLLLFAVKFFADIALLLSAAKFFKEEKVLILTPLLSLIYPFYVLTSAFGGIFGSFRWKN